jgi:hypothetical protein
MDHVWVRNDSRESLFFVLLSCSETRSCYVVGFELIGSSDPSASASQVAETTGVIHHT